MSYSTTLNIFIPAELTKRLKYIHIPGKSSFDWREPGICHCTVKALAISKDIPVGLKDWEAISGKILSRQAPFSVAVKEFMAFPGVAIAKLQSPELLALHKRLCAALPSSQPQYEGDNYVPHISLAITGKHPCKPQEPDLSRYSFVTREIQLVVWDLSNLNKPDVRKEYLLSSPDSASSD